MILEPLATVSDLAKRLGRDLSASDEERADLLLQDASAAVRNYTGQQFTLGQTTITAFPRNGRIRLGQRPIVSIDDVVDADANPLSHQLVGKDSVQVGVTIDEWQRNGSYRGAVTVTYTHGYEDGPPDTIVGIVCQIAGRALGRPADSAGLTGESIEGYSYTVGTAAASGAFGMLPDERRTLDRYARRAGTAVVG